MASYRQVTNDEVRGRLETLREQANAISAELSWLSIMSSVLPKFDPFKPGEIQDRITTLALAIDNLKVEADVLWKLTRR